MSVNIVNKSTGALTKIAGNPVEQASGISYDHTSSGMQANNVQAAVDELMSGLTDLTNVVGWGVDGGNVLIPMANGEKNGVTFARVFDSTGYVVSYSLSGATTRDNTSVIMYELPVKDSDTKYKIKVFNIPTVHIIWDDTSSSTIPLGTGVITVPANHSVFIGMYVATAGTDVTGGSVQIMATTNTDNPMDTYYPTRPVIGSAVADMKSRIEAVESGLTNYTKLDETPASGTNRDKFNSIHATINALSYHDKVASFIDFNGTICRFADISGSIYTYVGNYWSSGTLKSRVVSVDSQYSAIKLVGIDTTGTTVADENSIENDKKFALYI